MRCDFSNQVRERLSSYTFSPSSSAVLELILEKVMCRKEEKAHISSAMNMIKKANSIPETIPSGPLTSTGLLHKARRPALLLLPSNSIK